MKKILSIVGFFSCLQLGMAQTEARFSAEVAKTTVGVGKKLKVVFSLENAKGSQFEAPDFVGLEVVSGPNVSSNVSIINGEVSQSTQYTYYLVAQKQGKYEVPSAGIKVGKQVLRTEAIPITVTASDDTVDEEDESTMLRSRDPFSDFFGRGQQAEPTRPQEPIKKKRATSRL